MHPSCSLRACAHVYKVVMPHVCCACTLCGSHRLHGCVATSDYVIIGQPYWAIYGSSLVHLMCLNLTHVGLHAQSIMNRQCERLNACKTVLAHGWICLLAASTGAPSEQAPTWRHQHVTFMTNGIDGDGPIPAVELWAHREWKDWTPTCTV